MTEFDLYKRELIAQLLETDPIHTGSWQRIDTSSSPAHATYELLDVTVRYQVPRSPGVMAQQLSPDLPWADAHFLERIGGEPLNPPPSHEIWPHAVGGNGRHIDGGRFSHTYPERFWPKQANSIGMPNSWSRKGIRYSYGDLADLITLMSRERLTRQAFLPIWFPEDTGVLENQRVPCTLGYHFMIRDDVLSCRYYMRSCDIYRHFTNDVYMAGRLMQHVANKVNDAAPDQPLVRTGQLTMYISSLHAFVGDRAKLEAILNG